MASRRHREILFESNLRETNEQAYVTGDAAVSSTSVSPVATDEEVVQLGGT